MERLHAPNEFFRIRRLCEGMRAWEELWRLLADGPRAGRATTAETPCAAGPDLVGPFMAVVNAFAKDGVDHAEPLTVDAAYAHSCDAALAESAVGTVGLEIEVHLVDLDHVADSVSCKRVETIAAVARNLVPNNAVTVEPGGQIELSGRPTAGISAAVARLRYESTGARLALADQRLRLAYAGADPARPSVRVNPRPRYLAMEQHFAVTGRAAAGRVMMNSTAALQVNLQAGLRGQRRERVARAYRIGPTLVAIAASSSWQHGRDSGVGAAGAYLFDFLTNT
jgi:gamma-glutamylcysteine synthetase